MDQVVIHRQKDQPKLGVREDLKKAYLRFCFVQRCERLQEAHQEAQDLFEYTRGLWASARNSDVKARLCDELVGWEQELARLEAQIAGLQTRIDAAPELFRHSIAEEECQRSERMLPVRAERETSFDGHRS